MLVNGGLVVDAGADVYHVHKLIVCSQDMSTLFMGGLVAVMRMKVYHVHKLIVHRTCPYCLWEV